MMRLTLHHTLRLMLIQKACIPPLNSYCASSDVTSDNASDVPCVDLLSPLEGFRLTYHQTFRLSAHQTLTFPHPLRGHSLQFTWPSFAPSDVTSHVVFDGLGGYRVNHGLSVEEGIDPQGQEDPIDCFSPPWIIPMCLVPDMVLAIAPRIDIFMVWHTTPWP